MTQKTKPFIKACHPNAKALEDLAETIDAWRPEKGEKDKSLIKCYTGDRRDLRVIYSYYRMGKWEFCRNRADSLDTLVREMIPQKIWDDIHSIDDE